MLETIITAPNKEKKKKRKIDFPSKSKSSGQSDCRRGKKNPNLSLTRRVIKISTIPESQLRMSSSLAQTYEQ